MTNFNTFIFNVFYYLKNPYFSITVIPIIITIKIIFDFFNLCKIPTFLVLSFLFNPSLKTLPKGEYVNFAC